MRRQRSILLASTALVILGGCRRSESPRPPADALRQAWSALRLEEFDEADRLFRSVLDRPTDPAQRLDALYGRGLVASLGRRDSPAARRLLGQVIAQDATPGRDMAAWASLAVVRDGYFAAADEVDISALRAGYTRVMDEYPASAAAEEAFAFRTALWIQTRRPADAQHAVDDLAAYLAEHPRARLRPSLFTLLSEAQEVLHHYPESLRAAIDAVESKEPDPANPRQNNILEYYRIGMMAQFDVGDFATARRYYEKFLAQYPRDQRAFDVRLLLNHLDETERCLRSGRPAPQLSAYARSAADGEGR